MSITSEQATVGTRVIIPGNPEPARIIEVDREGWVVVRVWSGTRHVGDIVAHLPELEMAP